MSTPPPEQIKTVETNIGRMIAFNDHVYTFGHTKIEVAFKLLSRTDTSDPIFAHDLSMRPRQTLEEFLGVKIADVIDVVVTVEGSRSFGLVIPEPPATNE